jgi:hypothetical protein
VYTQDTFLDFSNQKFFVGIPVSSKNWRAKLRTRSVEVKTFSLTESLCQWISRKTKSCKTSPSSLHPGEVRSMDFYCLACPGSIYRCTCMPVAFILSKSYLFHPKGSHAQTGFINSPFRHLPLRWHRQFITHHVLHIEFFITWREGSGSCYSIKSSLRRS